MKLDKSYECTVRDNICFPYIVICFYLGTGTFESKDTLECTRVVSRLGDCDSDSYV